jgi:hypothetical protein
MAILFAKLPLSEVDFDETDEVKPTLLKSIPHCGPLHGERVAMPKGIDGCGFVK